MKRWLSLLVLIISVIILVVGTDFLKDYVYKEPRGGLIAIAFFYLYLIYIHGRFENVHQLFKDRGYADLVLGYFVVLSYWLVLGYCTFSILETSYDLAEKKIDWISAFYLQIGSAILTIVVIERFILSRKREKDKQLERIEKKLDELLGKPKRK